MAILCVRLMLFCCLCAGGLNLAAAESKPRLLVLTDIGGDPDDQQSMVRLMLYANEFELEGLIASASGTPGELKEKVTRAQLICEIVEAYGQVRSNLTNHAEGYPTADYLLNRIKAGNPNRGLSAIGEGRDTDGSRWIIQVADKPDSRPLNLSIWGGQTDLAQALWRVRQDRGKDGLEKFVRSLRVYDVADQDGIVEYIWQEFPGLFYVLGMAPKGRDKREAVFRGMYLGGDESLTSRAWIEENLRQNHGPLGALYPAKTWTAPNPHAALKEGDTPSWLFFLPNGIGDSRHPEWGGWGGRFALVGDQRYRDAQDTVGQTTDARVAVWRWRPVFQSAFQARMDWGASPDFKRANHCPIAALNGDISSRVIELSAAPGSTVTLTANGTKDPDDHALQMAWFQYPEAGTFKGDVQLSSTRGEKTSFVAPSVSQQAIIHVILQVTDNGSPALTAFRRAVVTVHPK